MAPETPGPWWRRMARDPLVRHSVLLMAASQAGNLANLVFQVVMNRRLPDAEYGMLASMLAVMMVLLNPLDAVRTALAHRVSMLDRAGRLEEAGTLARQWFRRLWAVGGVAMAAGIAIAPWVTRALDFSSWFPVVSTMVGGAAMFVFPVVVGTPQGLQKFGAMAMVQQLPGFVRLAAGVALVSFWPRAESGTAAQAVAWWTALIAGWGVLRRYLPAPPRSGSPVRMEDRYALRAFGVLMAYGVLMLADVIAAKCLFDPETAGVYARAATLARTVVFLPLPVAMALFPKVTTDGGHTRDGRRLLIRSAVLVLAIVAASAAAAWWCAPLVWRLFTGRDASMFALNLIRGLTVALSPLALVYLLANYELAQCRFRSAGLILGLAAVGYGATLTVLPMTPGRLVGVIGAWVGAASLALAAAVAGGWRKNTGREVHGA